ncbi:bifunctional methylenetetrahydrofolate dehydrogenase/methenyltetrahydrofolate cyclohydrolase FolD [Rhodocaloribacter litoris]|uniref:bifunctional methylenetetrahydrofolate dehydrogenase/methenyltetrahydrofolate cyclohydrolase FolD n=1 Tax=Rhodocaloribacter litoris TaxID=2558931 RepID=UPI0014233CE1|nr:bifunctional methylenetetrahydrofolate dehydrogenase/methenyltetrahydrofolate cyclohydrolase FolD [Rhodocaloribacter litoris]QXD14471.1 bifunctional methylenetetrahydrofolate dehydrogenase/methenyltetrahydrofolate cyclohydrolase FolD [Rhodocaloribacter litoris]
MAQLIDGKALAAGVRAEVRADVEAWTAAGHRPPCLRVVLVGDNPASASYVRGKQKAALEAGIDAQTLHFDASIPEAELLRVIDELNRDDGVDGILVQLPLPGHIDEQKVILAVAPEKDVDCFHPVNVGKLVIGEPRFLPCTPAGIMEMIRRHGIETRGRRAVVLGRSNIVGKPMANLLLQKGVDATVTVCHSRTRDLPALTREADLLIAAIGRARFVTAEMVKPGAVVIDVGINRVEDATRPRGYRLVGDVDFEAVQEKAGWITPVPGGVGPMTIAMLLKNTLAAARRSDA